MQIINETSEMLGFECLLYVVCLVLLSGNYEGFVTKKVIVFLYYSTLKQWLNKIIMAVQVNQHAEFVSGL